MSSERSVLKRRMTKRSFLKFFGCTAGALSLSRSFSLTGNARAQMAQRGLIGTRSSPYFTALANQDIQCELCPKRCRIPNGERGICRVRENRSGKCYSLVYGNPCMFQLDPIERKPFFHVLPASHSLSVATAGCNFECKFCETWELALVSPEEVYAYEIPPPLVVQKAKEMRARSVAFTFGEPVVFYEYMLDIGSRAKKAGLLSLMHSNGFINPAPLAELCRALDAVNIDLKSFSPTFYRQLCDGELEPVLQTLKTLRKAGVHLEITSLIIPTMNDEMPLLQEMCRWVKNELGAGTPIHFSRFYPLYKLRNLPPTPVSTLEQARALAFSAGLEYVYIGKVPGHEGENTFCPKCRKVLIQRTGYMIGEVRLDKGKCGYCGASIPGIWS